MDVWCHQNGQDQKYENTWNSESDRDLKEKTGEKTPMVWPRGKKKSRVCWKESARYRSWKKEKQRKTQNEIHGQSKTRSEREEFGRDPRPKPRLLEEADKE
uniref:Uncharacterized protein n=1 Tax=Cacopsylla melanoneura TaxID=428564 RepID=A0A8D9E2Y7_9HEMI